MSRRTRCLTCGASIGRHSATCPVCGAVQPHKRIGSTIGLAVLVVALVIYTIYTVVGNG